jgi:hypothetical protein
MTKTLFVIGIMAIAVSCSNSEEVKPVLKKEATKKSAPAVADSYTTDTMFEALPQLIEDLSAEKNIENLLAQNWTNSDDLQALRDYNNGSLEFPVRTFCMFTDKTVVKNVRNYMETGTWSFDNDAKIITFKFDGTKDVYKLRALAQDELRLTNIGIHSETVLVFSSDAKRHKNAVTDPFFKSNLTWRIAPQQAETDEQIKQRVKQYLEFFLLYYKDCIARRAEVVSFYGFPSCLKWYAGGIYIQSDKDILQNWYALFYNRQQGEKGLKMVSKLLEKKYTWPTGNQNWIKKNLFVLEAMYKNL